MTGAQRGDTAAPFARARDEGYVFRSQSLLLSFDAFADAERSAGHPVVISGQPGVGKTCILDAYLEERAEAGVLTIGLDAAVLEPGRVAELILAGFGQQPVPGASVRLALHDFIEDISSDGERPIVAVDGLEDAAPETVLELASLARAPDEGGTGFVLITSAVSPDAAEPLAVPPLVLGPLSPGEVATLFEQVVLGAGVKLSLGSATVDELLAATDGTMAQVGRKLDEAIERCLESAEETLGPHHVAGHRELDPLPSAEDIEAALLALGDGRTAEDREREIDQAFEELRRSPARAYQPRESSSYPKISAGPPNLPDEGPANDLTAGLNPLVVEALEEVAQSLRHLRLSIDAVREETDRLTGAADARKASLAEAAGVFAESLQFRSRSSTEE